MSSSRDLTRFIATCHKSFEVVVVFHVGWSIDNKTLGLNGSVVVAAIVGQTKKQKQLQQQQKQQQQMTCQIDTRSRQRRACHRRCLRLLAMACGHTLA